MKVAYLKARREGWTQGSAFTMKGPGYGPELHGTMDFSKGSGKPIVRAWWPLLPIYAAFLLRILTVRKQP